MAPSRGSVSLRLLGLAGLCLAACTPLGGWLYSDPTFRLSEVAAGGTVADSMELVLTGCNLNDYDLYALAFEGTLLVGGRRVGAWAQHSPAQMHTRDSSRLVVPLVLEERSWGDDAAVVPYQLLGTATVRTPIGDRMVAVDQRGSVRLTEGDPVEWTVRNGQACRPGQVAAPHLANPKQILRPEDFRRP